jgi:hypothetical protein
MNDKLKQIQEILGVDADGIFGPKSQAALDALVHPKTGGVTGDGTWPWIQAKVDGNDIVIESGVVTAFGGASDTMDSGETASGLSTKDNPSFIGCALPMRRDGNKELRGSPIPKLPWKTTVIFSAPDGTQVSTKLIDEGPAKWTKHIGDLTEAAAKLFDPTANANNFEKTLGIRIVGGAQYL